MTGGRPHIVHYLEGFNLAEGGVVRAVLDMVDRTAHHAPVTILTRDDTDVPDDWKRGDRENITVKRLQAPPGRLGMMSNAGGAEIDADIKGADVVHLHTAWNTANLGVATLARKHGVPYIISVHGMLDDWSMSQSRLKKRVFHAVTGRKLLESAFAVHCTAEAELEQSRKWYPTGNGVVIPLIFDTEPYEQLPTKEQAEALVPELGTDLPKVHFLSRVHVKKGLEHLIRASAVLRSKGGEHALLVAGSGDPPAYLDEMKRLAQSEGVADSTSFLGLVTGEAKTAVIRGANVLAVPTSQENFGFVFPEGLACQTPVVTTKGVDIWPELEASGGAVITTQDPRRIADDLAGMLQDPQRLAEMGEKGRDWVMDHLDPTAVAGRFMDLYRRATSEARG